MEGQIHMATAQISPSSPEVSVPARRRSNVDVVILIGLAAVVTSDVVGMVRDGRVIPPVMVFMSIYLICGIIVATGWRWSMVFPLVFCTLGLVGELSTGYPEYALTHPSDNVPAFHSFVINYPLLLMVVGFSAVKLAQTLRRETPHLTNWMRVSIGVAIGLMLGAFLIGTFAQTSAAGGAAASHAGTQTVHLASATFAPDIVALHKGDTLTVVDDGPVPHTLTNGTWSADNKPEPGIEPGAPTISNVNLNNNTVTVGPFTMPGTYHIYCTVHPGMSLTVIVQ
jgi:plastocyanin